MAKHIWEWDKRSSNPMVVVCIRCGKRVSLADAITEDGCQGCPVEGFQAKLFGDITKIKEVKNETTPS